MQLSRKSSLEIGAILDANEVRSFVGFVLFCVGETDVTDVGMLARKWREERSFHVQSMGGSKREYDLGKVTISLHTFP